jgi:DNA (cytosine-5)-methyltransferase 1
VLVVGNRRVRTRLLTAREAARLMGVPEDYPLPGRYNESYHLFGDGVAVPVVRYLAEHALSRK